MNNWLGRSQYGGDANLQGEYDEFRVYDHVLTPQEVAGDFQEGAANGRHGPAARSGRLPRAR